MTRFYQKNQKCGTPEMRKELNQLRESLNKHIALERQFVKDLFDIGEAIVMSRCLLNIAKRSLLRLMLSCVGLASKHAAG